MTSKASNAESFSYEQMNYRLPATRHGTTTTALLWKRMRRSATVSTQRPCTHNNLLFQDFASTVQAQVLRYSSVFVLNQQRPLTRLHNFKRSTPSGPNLART